MSNEAIAKGEAVLLHQARDKFFAVFGRQPTAAACAPGRVNLIGDHIDYCEGFVLPVVSSFKPINGQTSNSYSLSAHYNNNNNNCILEINS